MDKIKIHIEILKQLKETYGGLVESAHIAKEASTNEESKAENKYDTRGLEASYLAGAQSKRALELKEKIYQVQRVNLSPYDEAASIGVGCLVTLSVNGDEEVHLFLLPVGGDSIALDSGKVIKSISVSAPLGRLICGKYLGESFLFKSNEYEILACI